MKNKDLFFFTEKILKNISIWNWEKRSKERNIYIEKPAKFLDLRRHLESFASTMHRNRSAHTTWFLSVFFHWIQLLSTVFCYSWLVCLLGFWLRNTSLVKVGNPISDGIVFVFHLAWCVRGLKSLKRFWPHLIVFSASRMVSLSNCCIWCLFFISDLMKPSVVYRRLFILCSLQDLRQWS